MKVTVRLGLASFASLALVLGACTGGPDDDGGGDGDGDGDLTPEEEAEKNVTDKVATFDTTGFAQINQDPADTQHGASPQASVWVLSEFANLYRELDPDDAAGTHAPFPEGFIAIKQQLDAAGEPVGRLLVMSKFFEGYSPDTGDWWWGLFEEKDDLSGTNGGSGSVQFCIDCHVSNGLVDTDYMQGVDNSNFR